MRSAPPAVDVALASGRRERGIAAVMHAVAGALVGAWLALRWEVPVAGLASAFGFLAGGLGAWQLRPLQGRLRWDGERWWHLPACGPALALHRVELMMDLGGWLLLRSRPDGRFAVLRDRWCGVARADAGAGWHGLRLALYQAAPATTEAGRAAG